LISTWWMHGRIIEQNCEGTGAYEIGPAGPCSARERPSQLKAGRVMHVCIARLLLVSAAFHAQCLYGDARNDVYRSLAMPSAESVNVCLLERVGLFRLLVRGFAIMDVAPSGASVVIHRWLLAELPCPTQCTCWRSWDHVFICCASWGEFRVCVCQVFDCVRVHVSGRVRSCDCSLRCLNMCVVVICVWACAWVCTCVWECLFVGVSCGGLAL
jgi:hypothetical protein